MKKKESNSEKKSFIGRCLRNLRSFLLLTKQQGFTVALQNVLVRLSGEKDSILATKKKILNHLLGAHGKFVAHGYFKGMQLGQTSWWGGYDLISKILGVYENHVLDALIDLKKRTSGPFVDIGAADGYFAIGAAFSGLSEKVYAFEISEKGRQSLVANAEVNGCSDKICILPEANFESLFTLMSNYKEALVLIDIEGGEYQFLSDRMLSVLKHCSIVVELHPWQQNNGEEKQKHLLEVASQYFKIKLLERETYNPNQFAELKQFSDDERLIALSEGRERNMQWLVMSPLRESNI